MSWREGLTTAERGYGSRWQRARERFLVRHPLCRHCEAAGIVTPAVEVDHVNPHKGDQALFWSPENWQPLCSSCHAQKTAREQGRRTRPRIGLDGWPLDP